MNLKLDQLMSLPAPGAFIISLISQFSAEQRRENKETAWLQSKAVADSMKDQASKMKTMAGVQLTLGVISGGVSIAGGAIQAKTAVSGAMSGDLLSSQAQGKGMAYGGGAKIVDAFSQFATGFIQADIKGMEADQEKIKAMRDNLNSLNEALREVIQKAIASMEGIQQARNQATTRILA
jgi:hypothetical protein